MYKVYAGFVGLLITVMITFNGVLSEHIGNYFSLIIIHMTGIATLLLIFCFKREKPFAKSNLPMYLYMAGGIGVIMVILNNVCVNSIGVSLTISLGMFGQLVLSSIIDHFGLLGMEEYKFQKQKLIGFIIIIAGLIVMTL